MSIPNNKKSETGAGSSKKMLIYDEQSRNVYENKQNMDKMPGEKTDIYVEVTRILQKIAGLSGPFGLNCHFDDVPRAQEAGLRRHSAIPQARDRRYATYSPLQQIWTRVSEEGKNGVEFSPGFGAGLSCRCREPQSGVVCHTLRGNVSCPN